MLGKSAGEVVSEIIMLKSVNPTRAFLVVEGRDDCKFWKRRVHELCVVIDSTGKPQGVAAVRKLNARNFIGHVGVFDRDYEDALRASNWQANEIYWDAHSLETVLFYSAGFENALVEHANEGKLRALEVEIGRPLREVVEWVARAVGSVRYVHYLSGNGGDASRLHPTQYLRERPFEFDEEAMLTAGVQIGAAPSVLQLKAYIHQHGGISARLLIRGHDVSAVVAWVVRCCGGACGQDSVERVFRLGFTDADLGVTTVYSELREWEVARAPRRILAF